jgi:hypothetical protein
MIVADDREPYGRIVRETWVGWALEQPAPKPSWRAGWDDLDDGQREVDMRIGSAVAAQAVEDAKLRNERMEAQLFALGAHLPAIRRALTIAISEAEYETGKKPYRAALQAVSGTGEGAGNG